MKHRVAWEDDKTRSPGFESMPNEALLAPKEKADVHWIERFLRSLDNKTGTWIPPRDMTTRS